MSHEIVNEQIAYVGEVPWHGIGARMGEEATNEEWLAAAKLDWSIEQRPIFTLDGEGNHINVPGKVSLIRSTDNKVMDVTSDRWHPLQNSEIVDFMSRYTKAGGATMETLGALRDGKVVWCLARIGHDFEVGKGDTVNGYILITSPNYAGQSIQIRTTTVRVVCANTMAMAMNSSAMQYSQNHLTEFNVEGAREAVANAHEQLGEAERRAKLLAKLNLSLEDGMRNVIVPVFAPDLLAETEDAKAVMADLMNPEVMPKKLQAIMGSIQTSPGADQVKGTGWGILNGVTHYCDHVGGHNASSRMFRSFMGDYMRDKQAVEAKLLEMC